MTSNQEDHILIHESRNTKYNQLNLDQKRTYIQKVIDNNIKRKRNDLAGSSTNSKGKRKIDLFCGAQQREYPHGGQITHEPVCSLLHKLQTPKSCSFCGAKKFEHEPPTYCCHNGEIHMADVNVNDELYALYTVQTQEAIEFRRQTRKYNSIFSFTSFRARFDRELASNRKGIFTFRAQGQIYHNLPSLIPEKNKPSYFQLYFYDTENELQNRMGILDNANMSTTTTKRLMDILEGNPYAKFLRKLNDFPSLEDFKIIINRDAAVDQRVYNSPTVDQVAAIWVEGNNDNVPYEREIVVHSHSGKNHQVKHYFGCYDPLQYPLLFPGGDVGWHQNIKRRDKNDIRRSKQVNTTSQVTQQMFTSAEDIFKREREGVKAPKAGSVSCREYYCYKFQIRDTRQSTVLTSAGRLFHQYAVDMYIKLETTRLDYFRKKQSEIRAELFQGIVDSVASGEANACQVGKRIVLPSSFIGGPRDMRRRYLDAMSLVQRFGKPDIFITMTCNPEWEEITEELHPGQTHNDRPDLTSRIFRGKLQDLKDQLFKKEIFGKVAAHVHVIEFQKRGLPHAHMLIILMGKHKIVSSNHYDKYVSAEIPNQYENPILYELVDKYVSAEIPNQYENPILYELVKKHMML
ncbi:uncharacterized protein LOC109821874 [Asparagus officinalis]|uniref:uncharacterized protein LOC109821874 n=1 Tax=Asparagus officinalis TaxID=4686 RepID=UPI00098DEEB1|nr:uncharacterized protein LOC109821874 [Asparagus officinalis]